MGKKIRKGKYDLSGLPEGLRRRIIARAPASRNYDILQDCLKTMDITSVPVTFFLRYDDAMSYAKKVTEKSILPHRKKAAQRALDDLTANRDARVTAFAERCSKRFDWDEVKADLLSGKHTISDGVRQYIEEKL